jgi:HK97 family phage portal protein
MQSLTYPPGQTIRIYDAHNMSVADVIGPTVINGYSALTVPAWFRAMNFLSTNLASFSRSVVKDGAKRTADEKPHALDTLLKRKPNGYQNPFLFWSTWFLHACHKGNGYARVERDFAFRPVAFHNLQPDEVWPFRYDREDGNGPMQFYYHVPTKKVYPGADILHLAGLSWDGMAGLDPVELHARTIERAATLDKYLTRFLRKGSVVKGAIEIPGHMSDEQLAQAKKVWRETFSGPDGQDDVAFITDGGKLNNATLNAHDSQLVQQAAYGTKQIAQATGVPPEVLFELAEAKYNASVEQAGQNVVRYCFRPIIEQAEAELSLKLLSEADQEAGHAVKINADALLRGDTKAVSDEAEKTVKSGLRTRNEGRALLSLPPDSDPESDKLKAIGDSTPAATDPATTGG